ncbi:MAG: hypothetical protein ABI430_01110 [Candidatus Taylorbacteria bacterium]
MKNPYLRSILITSLIISILFVVASVVGQWATLYSISHYGSTDMTGDTWTFIEKPNVYGDISKILSYVETGTFIPLYPLFFVTDLYLVGIIFELIGPIIVFLAWFIILYIVTYLYAKFVKKNLTTEARNHKLLITICVLTIILMSAGQLLYLYKSQLPKSITLDSVSPNKASDGESITLSGSGFSANDITVWLVGKKGQNNIYGFLWGGRPKDDKTLNIQLKTIGLCENALQDPCHDALENFGSGNYSIEIRGGDNTPSVPFEVVSMTTGITFTGTTSKSQQINSTVNKETFTIPINYLPIDELASMTKNNMGIKIDYDIREGNFDSSVQSGKQETLALVSFDQYLSTDEAVKVINELGYRPANIAEFISFVWNEYKSLKNVAVSTAIISKVPLGGTYMTPVFHWINGVPQIDLRSGAQYQEASEFSLIVKVGA